MDEYVKPGGLGELAYLRARVAELEDEVVDKQLQMGQLDRYIDDIRRLLREALDLLE